MIERQNIKKPNYNVKHFWVADFETLNNEDNPVVFLWGIAFSKDKQVKTGLTIDSFIHFIFSDYVKNKVRAREMRLFFNNSSKFDAHFIIKALDRLGFTQQKFRKKNSKVEQPNHHQSEYRLKNTQKTKRDKKLQNYQYSIFSDEGQTIYKMVIKKNYLTIAIFCSLRMFGYSVAKMGDMLNKINNNNKYTKGKLILKSQPYLTLEEAKQDTPIYDYLIQDVRILMEFLIVMNSIYNMSKWKITQGAISINEWYISILPNLIEKSKEKIKVINYKGNYKLYQFNNSAKKLTNKQLSKLLFSKIVDLKTLNNRLVNQDIRNWQAGGLTHCNPACEGIKLSNISVYDINSSYPAVMNSKLPYPIGTIHIGNVKGDKVLRLYEVFALSPLVNKNGLPFIAVSEGVKQYLSTIPQGTIFYLTCAEMKRFKIYYQGDYDYRVRYSFKSIEGEFYFKSLIDKWMSIKNDPQSHLFLKGIAKITMNSNYGKHGSKTERMSKIFNPNWNGTTHWENDLTNDVSKFYLPLAIFITAYARMKLVDCVGNNYNQGFIYTDTDSIHTFNVNNLNIEIDTKKLGAWKCEGENLTGCYGGKKSYILEQDNKVVKKALKGIRVNPLSLKKLRWYHIIIGYLFKDHKEKKELEKGLLIVNVEKKLPPIWDLPHYNPERSFSNKNEYLEIVKNFDWFKEIAPFVS